MLELKKIHKIYKTGDFIQTALKEVNLKFRKKEFVAVLGPSGSGKTTLLNIVGGLDRYTTGDLIINNKSTKDFKDRDWDTYRNNCIGFIFQSYNLINHISILENVELGMTLSGVSLKTRREKAMKLLDKVGLKDHAHKKPNQLSGGQMQRVAIARALANDPEIILADEPTGALDTKTSVQIMELIREIAKDKLVIMVTHNPELANDYANRIVEMRDGEVIKDTNPINSLETKETYNIRKTAMSFLAALKLSFNNVKTKKGRTFLTAFASSIGVIGIALILSLSNGMNIQIDKFETETLSSLPIMINEQAMEMNMDAMKEMHTGGKLDKYPDKEVVFPYDSIANTMIHTNNLTTEYMDYINKLDKKLLSGLSYTRITGMNILTNNTGVIKPIPTSQNMGQSYFSVLPESLDNGNAGFIEKNYEVLKGTMPETKNDLVIVVDSQNRVDMTILKMFGIDTSKKEIDFNELIGKELKLVLNNDYYKNMGNFYTMSTDYENMYNSESSITLKVTGIMRGKKDNKLSSSGSIVGYTEKLVKYVVEQNSNSDIVKLQNNSDYNVLTGEKFDTATGTEKMTKEQLLAYLGADTVPYGINIYPVDFKSKEAIIDYLDKYNENKDTKDKIVYTDLAATVSQLSSGLMDAITYVLVAFSAISLVVSSIMIGIITYISVLERTKEIGVLRALGARKI